MTLHTLSNRFLTEISRSHNWNLSVQIFSSAGVFQEDITKSVLTGAVGVDETREVRRQLSMTIQGTKDLIPHKAGDLLHPATSNEVHVGLGVRYSDSTTENAPLGVFRLSKPTTSAVGGNTAFTISGNDRASVVAREGWQAAYQIPAGTNMAAALQNALQFLVGHIYPNLDYSTFATPDTFLFPITTFGINPGTSTDPMADLQTFAAAAGCELFFDPLGNPVFRPIVNPATSLVVDGIHFVEGENCTMAQVGRVIDETVGWNGIQLTCNGPGIAGPFKVSVFDTNPASPTYYLGPYGQVFLPMTTTTIPAGSDTLPVAQAKGLLMAQQQLQLILGALDTTNLTTVPNPALREGDCVRVRKDSVNIDNTYVISNMNIGLGPDDAHIITFRPQVSVS